MNEQLVLTLLSGFIGAIGGSIITIGFTLWKDNKQENRRTAKEKLEKVYGPLVALKKKIDLRNRSDGGFLLPSTTQEIAVISLVTKLTELYRAMDAAKDGNPNALQNLAQIVKKRKKTSPGTTSGYSPIIV